ncbi:MAG: hypothetical protein MPJ50_07290 [Pirellulales bacterium]|nr:hypothetical protein [Pirellulales bacterium]
MAGENLDLSSEPDLSTAHTGVRQLGVRPDARYLSAGQESRANARDGRRFVGVTFACCDIYARVYINRDETAYQGRCPRCCKPVLLKIGPGGVDSRFFTAY